MANPPENETSEEQAERVRRELENIPWYKEPDYEIECLRCLSVIACGLIGDACSACGQPLVVRGHDYRYLKGSRLYDPRYY